MKVVQERLGHSTMMLTADTYSHVSAGPAAPLIGFSANPDATL
jgi:hypothetical protein